MPATTRGALMPVEFLEVQWTRLQGGQVPSAFADRVRQLLAGPVTPSRRDRERDRAYGMRDSSIMNVVDQPLPRNLAGDPRYQAFVREKWKIPG